MQTNDANYLFYELIENSNDFIYTINADGYITYANNKLLNTLGVTVQEILNTHYIDFVHQEYKDYVLNFYENQLKHKKENTYLEFITINKKGEEFWIGQEVKTIYTHGLFNCFYVIGRDINKAKVKQLKYVKLVQTLSSLFKNIDAGILLIDENGKTVYANQRYLNIFDIQTPLNQFIGKTANELAQENLVHFENPSQNLSRVFTLLNDRKLVRKEEVRFKNGNIFERDYIPIYETGVYKGHFWMYYNVTTEKQLTAELNNYKYALDQSSIVVIANKDGIITNVNDKFCDISKYTKEELLTSKMNLVNSAYHPTEFFENLWDTIQSGKVLRTEIRNKSKDGHFYWVDSTIIPFVDENNIPFQYVAIQSDITSKKEFEAQLVHAKQDAENSLKIKEEFISNMSHEIRTPMNALIGFTDLLLETELTTEQREHLITIKNSEKLLLTLINDILDLAKLESGKIFLENVPFNIHDTLQEVVKLLNVNATEKNIELELFINSKVPQMIIGDTTRVQQIILNTVGNAIKFTEKGEVSIYVKSIITQHKEVTITFEIKDTGIGIPKSKLDTIFDSFEQASNSTTRLYGGTGLGLSIVKKLVDTMNGEITVESEVEVGSTFKIKIPFKMVDDGSVSLAQIMPQIKKEELSPLNLKVLLVEDNKTNQLLANTRLTRWNCEVEIANHGKEAMELLEKYPFDIVLMDIQMPIMNGFEATSAIRSSENSNYNQIPIIAMTAHASHKEAENAIKRGMNDYIFKPFDSEVLHKKILKYTSKSVEDSNEEETEVSTEKLLDLKFLREETFNDKDIIETILNSFLIDYKDFLNNCEAEIENQNWEKIYALAHKIKPSISMLSINKLIPLIAEIEYKSKNQMNVAQISNLFQKCKSFFNQVEREINQEIKKLK
ncbi:MAG TPA: PAS domain S-box protein [Flavobacteriaceae bacterium]|nr:PAS domain S-box protein [Flavobacteriaceae bacterium]HEX5743708.1 PAS domain S-box protein [Flavobacteriaceae bacterium]